MQRFLKVSFALLASSSQVFQNSNEFTFLQYSKALTIRKVASYRQHAEESQEERDLGATKDARAEQAAHVAAQAAAEQAAAEQAAAEQADLLEWCAALENLDRITGEESRETKKCHQIIGADKESQEKRDLHAKQPRKDATKDAQAEQAAQAAAEQAMSDLYAARKKLDKLHAKQAKKDAKKRQSKFGCFCGGRQK